LLDLDVLVTSFPQTWGSAENEGDNYDFLTNLVEYIRGSRDKPFYSIQDLARTIVKRCTTLFSDPKLLLLDALLLEVYSKVIGKVVWMS
jgi:hypothetical protein